MLRRKNDNPLGHWRNEHKVKSWHIFMRTQYLEPGLRDSGKTNFNKWLCLVESGQLPPGEVIRNPYYRFLTNFVPAENLEQHIQWLRAREELGLTRPRSRES
ncbi:MAG: hypothetical protein HJJLKODD_01912 [Phycisphaerae bacterium]|nr:hypothetical protein [Phycisphaerae bacterium]